MPKYILDPCVEEELWEIWRFIAQDNPDAATKVIEAAYETFRKLAANPNLGRRRKFLNPKLRDVRSWHIAGFANYVIFLPRCWRWHPNKSCLSRGAGH